MTKILKKMTKIFKKKYQIFKKWSVFEEKTKFFWKNRDFSKVWNFPRICCNGNDIFEIAILLKFWTKPEISWKVPGFPFSGFRTSPNPRVLWRPRRKLSLQSSVFFTGWKFYSRKLRKNSLRGRMWLRFYSQVHSERDR